MSTNINLRKREFINDLMFHFDKLPGGAPAYRKKAKITLLAITNDLAFVHGLPQFLKNLKAEAIIKVVRHWQHNKINPRTIQNRLGMLRRVLSIMNPPLSIPSNKDLGVIAKQNRTLYPIQKFIDPNDLNFYPFSIIKDICRLQYLFGLKPTEAMKISLSMINENHLDVPRMISFNKKDRIVPVCTEPQKALIIKFKTELKNYLPIPREYYQCFIKFYQITLRQLKIEHEDYFRHFYIKNRHQELKFKHNHQQALQMIKAEVGYSRLSQLKGVIPCPENF